MYDIVTSMMRKLSFHQNYVLANNTINVGVRDTTNDIYMYM